MPKKKIELFHFNIFEGLSQVATDIKALNHEHAIEVFVVNERRLGHFRFVANPDIFRAEICTKDCCASFFQDEEDI